MVSAAQDSSLRYASLGMTMRWQGRQEVSRSLRSLGMTTLRHECERK
ncbi:MAG: hypothetical protein FWD09_07105 [Lentimicrobiaceae bacterium]|nr:hypothetical protein [Lentimicrobiaceae bacterium]